MKLHTFNPGHDIALASNRMAVTMPHAARELADDLGWIPALWADAGDCILVHHVDEAYEVAKRFFSENATRSFPDVRFVGRDQLGGLPIDEVCPWGWDACLVGELLGSGVAPHVLPTIDSVRGEMRELSHRKNAIPVLQRVRMGLEDRTCGKSACLQSFEACIDYIGELHGDYVSAPWRISDRAVFKAPWSSSGRGVRFVEGSITPSVAGWMENTIRRQGSIMAEPYYQKVEDFALEFVADVKVRYVGLSLFETNGSAYSGNIVASEEKKRQMLGKYIDGTLLDELILRLEEALTIQFGGKYCGPLGVDMMVVAGGDDRPFRIHPCVEINLRRTMGHVALALTSTDDRPPQVMSIVRQDQHSRLTVRPAGRSTMDRAFG